MNNRPTNGGGMPGYTGYKSAQIREEQENQALQEMTMRRQEEDAQHKNRVPGYQGYVPQIRSENVYGSTFGSTTTQQKEGKIKAGFDCDNSERYRSNVQVTYTEQMQQKVFGRQPNASGGSGALSMNFEQAKRVADEKRKQNFELNKQRFYGEDNFDNNTYNSAAANFWGV